MIRLISRCSVCGLQAALLALCFSLNSGLAAQELSQEQLKQRNQRIAQMITGLTDTRERIHERAVQGLVRMGAPAIPDLRLLAADENPKLRLRVALIVSQIEGAEAEGLLLALSKDQEAAVREVAALGLGRKSGDNVLRRLAILLDDDEPAVRESAALGIGFVDDGRGIRLLANAYVAEQVPDGLTPDVELALRRARSAQFKALRSLAIRPHNISFLGRYLQQLDGPALQTLLEVSWEIGDPRLCIPLLEVLKRDVDLTSHAYAATSLSANGDSRCLEALCKIASGEIEGPRLEAAKTLSVLTGHQAGPGQAWMLWLRDHKEMLLKTQPRDALIARLHDPANTVTAAELQAFEPKELHILIGGILGRGAHYWPELAWRALAIDQPARWSSYLLHLHEQEPSEVRRVGLLLILYRLNDPKAFVVLKQRYETMQESMKTAAEIGSADKAHNSERLMLALFAK